MRTPRDRMGLWRKVGKPNVKAKLAGKAAVSVVSPDDLNCWIKVKFGV